jgi:hypothetical protein
LTDSDLTARRAAVDEIAARGVDVLSRVVEETKSEDPRRRRWAATAIGKMGAQAAEGATGALVELVVDRHEKVSKAAVRALRRFGLAARAASPVLVDKLNDRDSRHAAFLALVTIDPAVSLDPGLCIEALVHRRFEVRSWAQQRLIDAGDASVALLEKALETETRVRARAEMGKVLKKLRGS